MSSIAAPVVELADQLALFDPKLLPPSERAASLARFFATESGRQRTSRFWRIDLEAVGPGSVPVDPNGATVRIENPNARAIACDLQTAAQNHSALFRRAFGTTTAPATKFGALAHAFAQLGAFVYLPADADCDRAIAIEYAVRAGVAAFPSTVVLLERGARATVVERIVGGDDAFVCAATEIVSEENSDVHVTSCQRLAPSAQFLHARAARPGRSARLGWTCAELGARLSAGDLSVAIEQPGADAGVTAVFFPNQSQHVDLISNVDHVVGNSTSRTWVKSAATDKGQARYLGNIRIAPLAQRSDASLRDDALLLSESAHIDSVPALEIGANDVKAYHGATVGAIDREQIFYLQSRGIERSSAERMIALGFFEPAVERFPTEALRDEVRSALHAKLS
ncbi:MAG: SufD family Fe-S cluster assembly protein [Candidatus Eremiobacteraeota bacterium]|nr:SufD family Fe-S cluster assembly protein [Candidatus Eremiobacteraeota bacterium]MBV8374561.1 SufD family Fe-S cluster assembly protein [Candidatus Eremiobacteraeota bacterium]